MPLSTSVTPGKVFADQELVTTSGLNTLGSPVVTISGAADSTQITNRAVTDTKTTFGAYFYGTGGGTANAHTITTGVSLISLSEGYFFRYKASATNTGAVTIAVDSVAAKNLYKWTGTALAAGDIIAGQEVEVCYDGSAFQLVSQCSTQPMVTGTDSGTANAYALVTAGLINSILPTSLYNGLTVSFKATNANTGSSTFSLGSLGSASIKKDVSSSLASGDIKAGQWVRVVYDGTNWQLTTPVPFSVSTVLGITKGLVVKNNAAAANNKLDVTADEILVKDSASRSLALAYNATVDLTASGVNGLDAGSEGASTWYFLWAISDGTTAAGLFSTSSTSPVLPTNYTYKALIGAVYNNSSSNLQRIYQLQRRVHLDDTLLFNNQLAVSNSNYQAISSTTVVNALNTIVPSIAKTCFGIAGCSNPSSGAAALTVAGGASTSETYGAVSIVATGRASAQNSFYAAGQFEVPLITPQEFYWKGASSTDQQRVVITGYTI